MTFVFIVAIDEVATLITFLQLICEWLLPAGHLRSVRRAGLNIALCFPCLFVCLLVDLYVCTYHVCNNYMDLMAALSTAVTTMSTLAQLQV